MKVTVTGPEVTGSYVVAERRDDGTLVLRPETSEEVIVLESLDRLHAAVGCEQGQLALS